jgi:hypothetical protein
MTNIDTAFEKQTRDLPPRETFKQNRSATLADWHQLVA